MDAREKLIKYSLQELTKILQDVQQGKKPEMSKNLQQVVDSLPEDYSGMSEEEVDRLAQDLAEKISQ